eukprot:g5110.t1
MSSSGPGQGSFASGSFGTSGDIFAAALAEHSQQQQSQPKAKQQPKARAKRQPKRAAAPSQQAFATPADHGAATTRKTGQKSHNGKTSSASGSAGSAAADSQSQFLGNSQFTSQMGSTNRQIGSGTTGRGGKKAEKIVPKVELELGRLVLPSFVREIRDAVFRANLKSLGDFSLRDLNFVASSSSTTSASSLSSTDADVPFAVMRTSWDYASQLEKIAFDQKQECHGHQNANAASTADPRVPCVFGFFDRTDKLGTTGLLPLNGSTAAAAASNTHNMPSSSSSSSAPKGSVDARLEELMHALKCYQAQIRAARAVLLVKSTDRSTDYLAKGLIRYDLDVVEATSLDEAGVYVVLAVEAVFKSKTKKSTGEFHHRSEGCKSVPVNVEGVGAMFGTWCSMLMEIPGCGEEMAKVVAERWKSLPEFVKAVEEEAVAGGGAGGGVASGKGSCNAVERELEELAVPIRGKNETRRLGPVLAKRIVQFFASEDSAEIIAA